MANIIDYLGYELASFDDRPLNPLDAAILTQACMIVGEGVVPAPPRTPRRAHAPAARSWRPRPCAPRALTSSPARAL